MLLRNTSPKCCNCHSLRNIPRPPTIIHINWKPGPTSNLFVLIRAQLVDFHACPIQVHRHFDGLPVSLKRCKVASRLAAAACDTNWTVAFKPDAALGILRNETIRMGIDSNFEVEACRGDRSPPPQANTHSECHERQNGFSR